MTAANRGDCVPPRTWNFRVVGRTRDTGVPGLDPVEEWSFIEAYYDADDRLVAWCDASPPASDLSLDDLRGEVHLLLAAVDKPVVGEDELPGDRPWASNYNHGYETPIHAALAGLVRAQLRLQGQSQTWLAEACGLSQKHVSMMLTGLADGSFVTWSAMAKALGIEWRVGVAKPAHSESGSDVPT